MSLTKHTFVEHVGRSFRVQTGAAPVDLVLFEVTGLDAEPERPFSLLFRGPASRPLPQQIHALEHPPLDAFELFLVPVGREGDALIYEAVFN